MSSTVGVENYDAGHVLSRTLVIDIICVHQHVSKVMQWTKKRNKIIYKLEHYY